MKVGVLSSYSREMRVSSASFAFSSLVIAAVASTAGLRSAHAAPCPTVMIILDRSGSMDARPDGSFSGGPSKLDLAKIALNKLVMQYGDRLPFGFMTFASTGIACTDGVNVIVKPMNGSKATITSAINAVMTEGSTNTGPAIDAAMALPEMNDMNRPGSYILLVTDGEPNCAGKVGTEPDDPAYTIGAVKRAAMKGIKTFVVGFGALPAADKDAMNKMAMAGQEPCTGAACNGQQFYAAEDDAGLQAAIDSISSQIFGEFGGLCDDSCYANGCPNAGEICVGGKCKLDPCLSVSSTCAPGDYCYTDGNSPGTCTRECPQSCAPGESCTLGGCLADPCLSVSCDASTYCKNGACLPAACKNCDPSLFCIDGVCKDDPCRYVKCPMGAACQSLKGTCVSGSTDGTGANHGRGSGGCHFAPGAHADQAVLVFGLFALAVAVFLRRRAQQR